jgi:hypothetical protein
MISRSKMAFLIIFAFVFCIQDAFAYIGPGTASLYLQIILASFFTIIFLMKFYLRNIKDSLKRIYGKIRTPEFIVKNLKN